MISPLEVYFVMQLDTIGTVAVILSVVGTGATAVTLMIGAMAKDDNDRDFGEMMHSFCRKASVATAFFLATATFLPSTKTAAAMILVPALTSKEVTEPLSREAGELFDLAKDALRSAVKPDKQPEPAKEQP